MDEQGAIDRVFGILARNGIEAEEVRPGFLRIDRELCWIFLRIVPARVDLEMPNVGTFRTRVLHRNDHEGPVRRAVMNEVLRELNQSALFVRYEIDDDTGDVIATHELVLDDLQASELLFTLKRLELAHFFDDEISSRTGGMTHLTWLESDE